MCNYSGLNLVPSLSTRHYRLIIYSKVRAVKGKDNVKNRQKFSLKEAVCKMLLHEDSADGDCPADGSVSEEGNNDCCHTFHKLSISHNSILRGRGVGQSHACRGQLQGQ